MTALSVGVLSNVLRKWRVATQVLRVGLEATRVRSFGIPLCVSSEVKAFGTGVSCSRPPAMPFSREGWIVAADELAVREGHIPGLAPGMQGWRGVQRWRRSRNCGNGTHRVRMGSTGASEYWPNRFMYFISKT